MVTVVSTDEEVLNYILSLIKTENFFPSKLISEVITFRVIPSEEILNMASFEMGTPSISHWILFALLKATVKAATSPTLIEVAFGSKENFGIGPGS